MDINKFPANIYKVYTEYINEETQTRKLHLLFDVFGQVIRFFGCIFLSEYMYSETVDAKINDSIMGLTRPSLGTWFMFVREYAKLIYRTKDSFIREFGDCFIDIHNCRRFEKSYSGRFRNSSAKQQNSFDEIIMMRNAIAHGASTPTEEEARVIVDVFDQYLTKVLETFDIIFEKYTVAKAEEVEDCFTSIKVYYDLIRYHEKYYERFEQEFSADDDIMEQSANEYFAEGQMYLLSDDKRVLRLAEYLVDIIDEVEHEDYYLYDGYGNKNVIYIGMKYKKQIEGYLSSIKEKFNQKGASTKWGKSFFEYESFIEYVNDLSMVSIHIHEKTEKYNKRVYVERECDYLLEDFLKSDKTTMVVTAEAGVGKTNFLCHSAEKLIKSGNAVYFFNGNKLRETESENILFHYLQSECLNDKDFKTAVDFLKFIDTENKNRIPMVLLVDAANEAYDMLGVLQEIDSITSRGDEFPWLKIVVSIRTVSFKILKNRITDEFGKKFPLFTLKDRYYGVVKDNKMRYEVEIEEWNILQVIDAFEKYKKENKIKEECMNFHTMSRELQNLLHNPLNMGLFFWAQITMPERNIETEDDLYGIMESAWEGSDEVTKSMSILQKNIVNEMVSRRCNELDSDIIYKLNDDVTSDKIKDIRLLILSPLERLKDSGILYEKDEDGVFMTMFVYQKYLEYLILKGILSNGWDADKTIEMILESKNWNNLPEMYVSCLNYLEKDDSDNAGRLYSAALDKGLRAEEIQTAIIKLWKRRLFSDHVDEIADMIRRESLYEWGLKLANEMYINEESRLCYLLVDKLLKKDSSVANELYYQRGLYYMKVSRTDDAQRDLEHCIELSDGPLKNNATVQLAKNYRKMGDVPKAIEILDIFITTSDENTPYYADALIQRGLCSYSEKRLEEALDYYEKALRITEERKDHYVSVYNMLGMSTVHAEMGHLDECESILMEVLKRANDLGYIDLLADCLNGLSANYVRKEEYEKAISYAKQGLFIWKASDYYTGQAVMYCTIIKALKGLKRHDQITEYMGELKKIMPMIKEKVIIDLYKSVV